MLPTRTPAARRRAIALLAVAVPVAGWVFWQAQRTFRADVASAAARVHVAAWASGADAPKTPEELQQAREALQTAVAITPDDPDLHERLGDLHIVEGRREGADAARRREHFGRAVEAYRQALALRPDEPGTWAMLAAAHQVLGTDPKQVHQAWAKAHALGPLEDSVQPILLQIVLAGWADATPEMQAWAKGLFDAGDAATRRYINEVAKPYGLLFTPDASSAP